MSEGRKNNSYRAQQRSEECQSRNRPETPRPNFAHEELIKLTHILIHQLIEENFLSGEWAVSGWKEHLFQLPEFSGPAQFLESEFGRG